MKPIPIDVRSTSGPPVANFTQTQFQPNAIPNSSSNTINTPLNFQQSHDWNFKTSPIPPKRLEMVSRGMFFRVSRKVKNHFPRDAMMTGNALSIAIRIPRAPIACENREILQNFYSLSRYRCIMRFCSAMHMGSRKTTKSNDKQLFEFDCKLETVSEFP